MPKKSRFPVPLGHTKTYPITLGNTKTYSRSVPGYARLHKNVTKVGTRLCLVKEKRNQGRLGRPLIRRTNMESEKINEYLK